MQSLIWIQSLIRRQNLSSKFKMENFIRSAQETNKSILFICGVHPTRWDMYADFFEKNEIQFHSKSYIFKAHGSLIKDRVTGLVETFWTYMESQIVNESICQFGFFISIHIELSIYNFDPKYRCNRLTTPQKDSLEKISCRPCPILDWMWHSIWKIWPRTDSLAATFMTKWRAWLIRLAST